MKPRTKILLGAGAGLGILALLASGRDEEGCEAVTMTRREAALELLRNNLPAAEVPLPDDPPNARARFDEIAGDFFLAEHLLHGTTCGYLPPWLLTRLGFFDPTVIDRTDPEHGLVYVPGLQISRFFEGASKIPGCVRTFKPGVDEPELGDVVHYFRTGANGSFEGGEHVNIFISSDGDSWTTADGGRGAVTAQRIEFVARNRVGKSQLDFLGGPKTIVRFASLDAFPLGDGPWDICDRTAT